MKKQTHCHVNSYGSRQVPGMQIIFTRVFLMFMSLASKEDKIMPLTLSGAHVSFH